MATRMSRSWQRFEHSSIKALSLAKEDPTRKDLTVWRSYGFAFSFFLREIKLLLRFRKKDVPYLEGLAIHLQLVIFNKFFYINKGRVNMLKN